MTPAKLAQLQAAAELAEQTYKRDQEQFAAQAISQATLDTDVSTLKSARAQVAAQQALIEEKIVKAPFAGRLGIRQVDVGQYLTAGTTVVTLQALDPIFIDFYVPQQALAHLKDRTGGVPRTVDAYPGASLYRRRSSRSTPRSIPASRNVQVRASFRNAGSAPGSRHVRQRAHRQRASRASQITLPQTAITYNPYGDTVFMVEKDGVDEQGQAANRRCSSASSNWARPAAIRSPCKAALKAGEVVVERGPDEAAQRRARWSSTTTSCRPTMRNPTPPNE